MKDAEVYIKHTGSRFYYFCMYHVDVNGEIDKKWMALNFRPNMDSYDRIDAEPKQIDIPFKHTR